MTAIQPAAQLAESQRAQMTQTLFRELVGAAQTSARDRLKVRLDPVRARAAAGLEPEETPAKGSAK